MHETLHKNVNENMFSFTFLCNFPWRAIKATNMLQLYTANFLNGGPVLVFPIMVQMLFSQIQQASGPDFRMVGKSLIPTVSLGSGRQIY